MELDSNLVNDYRDRLRRFVAGRIRDQNDVDDVVQDAFMRFHAFQAEQDIISPFNYLLKIASNLVVDRARRKSVDADAIDLESVSEQMLGIEPSQEQGRHLSDLLNVYNAILADLPPRRREVFELRRHKDMSATDIASQLSITPRMVQKHILLAMAHLKTELELFMSNYDADISDDPCKSFYSVNRSHRVYANADQIVREAPTLKSA